MKNKQKSSDKFYVTTPIYYVTAKPHLGSLYSTVLADVAKRWHIIQGKNSFMLTGTDEHGQKIADAAQQAGMDPRRFADSFIDAYKTVWHRYHISYDHFVRTTDDAHVKAVQQWITDLLKTGDIYKGHYTGWYCTPCETYVTETESKGPACPSCGRPTHQVSEESYFFKLSAYQDKLLKFYQDNPDFVTPKARLAEVVNFVKGGLKDLSISRTTVTWGIPFPGDSKHVTYVWADALNNYITAIGYNQNDKQKEFDYWWPADLQILGKDIFRFHAVYWPAFLMASGLSLPRQLLVHGWLLVDHKKMSKSLGNVVDPMDLYQHYGADPVRYYLTRKMTTTHDSNFSTADLEQTIASDLANDLGNLLNRMTNLADKHKLNDLVPPKAWSNDVDDLRDASWNMLEDMQAHMRSYEFHHALARVWEFVGQVNAFFHANEPWKIAKTDKDRFAEIIGATAHSLYTIGVVLWPFMPEKMDELFASLGVKFDPHHDHLSEVDTNPWHRKFLLHKVPPLFKKPERNPEETMSEKMEEKKTEQVENNVIDITDFAKVELRVGTIESVEEVPESDKLYKLTVDLGALGKRQVLSGIKKHFTPEQLLNQQGVLVTNLKPRKMLGLLSEGMLLVAKDAQGALQLATVAASVPDGTQLK